MKIGDKVIKNPKTWIPNDFDSWGRGEGIGEIVKPPFDLNENEVDVRWSGGRCFEDKNQLMLLESKYSDFFKQYSIEYILKQKPDVFDGTETRYRSVCPFCCKGIDGWHNTLEEITHHDECIYFIALAINN